MEIKNVKKILIIQLRRIGDVLLTTPVIESLREHFPQSSIDFLVEEPANEVVQGNPYLDNVIISRKGFFDQVKLIKKIRQTGYDMVIDFLGNPRSAWICFFSSGGYRVGFDFRGRQFAYNIIVQRDKSIEYAVDFKMQALGKIGITLPRKEMFFAITPEAQSFADKFLDAHRKDGRIFVGITSCSRRSARMWLKEYFAQIADVLIEKYNSQVILFWGPGEKKRIDKIASLMRNKPVIAPAVTLKQLGALISRCKLMITNDNGPMHIAVSVGTPTVTIYGPTSQYNWNPPGELMHKAVTSDVGCLRCYMQDCDSMECMKKLTPDKVEPVIKDMLSILTQKAVKK
ncbi:MAG: glycosyltransferase family 9 protein [bacterium]